MSCVMSRAGAENETKECWKMAGLKETLEDPGSKLECPICFDDLQPPIFQCFNGHLLCGTCIEAVAECPICRDALPEKKIKALAVENLLRDFKRPCPFREQGCEKILTYSDGNHPFQCQYAHTAWLEYARPKSLPSETKEGEVYSAMGISEGSLSFTVENISEKLWGTKTMRSHFMFVQKLPWRIKLQSYFQGGNKKFLGIYLECLGREEGSSKWSCNVMATFRVLSQIIRNGTANHHTRKFNKREEFSSDCCFWGFSEFLDWAELKNPAKGFEKNGSVTVDVHIEADVPRRVGQGRKRLREN